MASAEGQGFLLSRVNQLHAYVAATGGDSLALAVLGATHLCVGAADDAVAALDKAVEQQGEREGGDSDSDGDESTGTYQSMCTWQHRARQQQHAHNVQRKQTAALAPSSPATMPRAVAVERVNGESLTREAFHERYAKTGTPVIITGVVHNNGMTSAEWTLEHIAKVAGKRPVTVKRLVPSSIEWAQLEDAEQTTVSAFIGSVLAGTTATAGAPSPSHPAADAHGDRAVSHDVTNGARTAQPQPGQDQGQGQEQEHQHQQEQERRYLFDWSLPLFAPELDAELSVPRYFNAEFDMLKQMPEGSKYRDSWPSLFVAPAGIRSELHVDTFASNFWMVS